MSPGMIHFPAAFTLSASAGTGQAARDPAQAIRPSRITTTASPTGAAPVPSTSVAPTNAIGCGSTLRVGNAVVTATFHPYGVRLQTRSRSHPAPPLEYHTRDR